MPSTALLTDHYELTMLQAALGSGAARQPAVFEVLTRRLPPGRRYGVFAGAGRLLDAFENFRFGAGEIELLRETGVVNAETAKWLARQVSTPPKVDIVALAEGEAYGPDPPYWSSRAPSDMRCCSRRWCSRSSITTAPSRPRALG